MLAREPSWPAFVLWIMPAPTNEVTRSVTFTREPRPSLKFNCSNIHRKQLIDFVDCFGPDDAPLTHNVDIARFDAKAWVLPCAASSQIAAADAKVRFVAATINTAESDGAPQRARCLASANAP
jgi:hypothetical protein